MFKKGLLALVVLIISSAAIAQDTTWVNTLNFSDITKRKGTFIFPDGKTYRKINMHYTLKCDPQTSRDNFNCGEWDYLSYVIVHDSTGRIDSNEFEHSNFLIGDLSPMSYDYSTIAISDTFYKYNHFRVVTSVTSSDSIVIGAGSMSSSEVIDNKRVQYLYTANELITAGVQPGDITALSLYVASVNGSIPNMRIRMAQTNATTLPKMIETGFNAVYEGNFVPSLNKVRLESIEPIKWDGVSNIVIEFSRAQAPTIGALTLESDLALIAGIQETGGDNYYEIKDDNFMTIEEPETVFADVDSAVSISFWAKGDSKLPLNTSVLEAKDKNGKRLINIHFPWSNGQVYWDAGNETGFDRISKATDASVYKNSWNHWVFTKNVRSGAMKIYLNGVLWHSAIDKNRDLGTIAEFRVGKGIKNYQYAGAIDRLSIWKSELNAAQAMGLTEKDISITQPNFSDLVCAFSYENYTAQALMPSDFNSAINAQFRGATVIKPYASEAFFNTAEAVNRPKVEFVSSMQQTTLDSSLSFDVVQRPQIYVDEFKDAQDVRKQTGILAAYAGGFVYSFNPDGSKKDSSAISGSQTLNQTLRKYYIRYEVINNVEIARYITPYGIGLDLGPDGFKWIYDVTDYASLLEGDVTFTAGNQQELIDLRFEMIEGTPVRDLKEISYYINRESRSYRNMADDINFQNTEIALHPDAKTYKLVTRITGHGHNTDDNTKPHCCEWADKQHYLKIDGKDALQWDIWQDDKCALNPIFDQGGNWAPPRAGWCPGAPVDDYNFDITPFVSGNKVSLDYDIEPVPTNNLGQGGGNYVVSMHLMQYGAYNFQNDATVEQIISPNNMDYYLRMNPTCGKPQIQVRNTGKNTITELGLKYGVVGGNPITYYWKDTLLPDESKVVELPFAIWDYLTPETGNKFFAEVFTVNNVADEYADNNRAESEFDIPNMAPKTFTVYFRNNTIADASLQIFDDGGTVVYEQLDAPGGQLIKEDITLKRGCYKLVCETENQFGLFYPLIPEIGSGLLRLIKSGTSFNQSFNPDFGKSVEYYFTVGHTLNTEDVIGTPWTLYPNPSQGLVTLQTNGASDGNGYQIVTTNVTGQVIKEQSGLVQGGLIQLNLKGQKPGIYMVELIENNKKSTFKIAIQ
ncbi:MAG: hypothetical protein ACI9JN_002367 [Bacteroidia bacterium]|jgi:hypothetical protein